ncbi:MAG: cation-translocating P-type ATPase [Deltaproteobacteria bacterium]|nr:cation-translocating P-type ATPase [Deltaproteobacteria bacterium]
MATTFLPVGHLSAGPPTTATPAPPRWHALTGAQALTQLKSTDAGLSPAEAARRLNAYGPNTLAAARAVSPWKVLADQFKNVLMLILLVAVVLSAALGHALEAVAIGVILLFAAGLGFVQEYRAERAMEALRKLAAPAAKVIRDGTEHTLPSPQVVPGDVVLLHAGDRVPADARLLEAVNLQADEALLTGESVPVDKHADAIPGADVAVADRRNMVNGGTAISYGRGRAVVVSTGMATEFGRVAGMLQDVQVTRTPLQVNLDRTGRTLARVAAAVVVVIVALGLIRGQPLLEMLVFGIALAVAVVPEALPAVVTISLALGVQRMVGRNALVRRLAAVETLGSTSVICSDKTGTLTRDEMTARRIWTMAGTVDVSGAGYAPVGSFSVGGQDTPASPVVTELLRAAALCSDAHLAPAQGERPAAIHGDPTEGALVVAAAKAGLDKVDLDRRFPRRAEVPFTSERKRMTTLHDSPDGWFACVKGAPEAIIRQCTGARGADGRVVELTAPLRDDVLRAAGGMADQALRVLAVATRTHATLQNAEEELTLLGLVGLLDPPRPEAHDAIRKCESAGIRVVMITGDHPSTARAIAGELGILGQGRVVTGAELDALPDDALARVIDDITVYARVSPAHKLRVVEALQARKRVVAMTGDGVNDAPALKRADIGIAMGISGTDVTREAAAMTLTDDNFASIVAAVEEGRGIFGNIKKYLMYLLSSNIGEIGLMAGAALLGLPLPLTAVQILYVNLATDGLPALALAVDPPEKDLMQRPPRDAHRGIFTRPVVLLMLLGGAWSAILNLSLFAWALQRGMPVTEAMTLVFVSLVLVQFFKAYNFRSDHRSVLDQPFANRWLNRAIAWELLLLVLIVELPVLHAPFNTYALSAMEWLAVVGLASTVSLVLELGKWMERRGWFGRDA